MIYNGKDSEHGKPVADEPAEVDDPALVTSDPAGEGTEEADMEALALFSNPLNPFTPDCAMPSM